MVDILLVIYLTSVPLCFMSYVASMNGLELNNTREEVDNHIVKAAFLSFIPLLNIILLSMLCVQVFKTITKGAK